MKSDGASETSLSELRRAVRQQLPRHAFQPHSLRGIAALAQTPIMLGLMWVIARGGLAWYWRLGLSIVLGQVITSIGLIGHEALHRAVFKSRFWEDVVGWISFCWYGLSPEGWRGWHVQAHHGHTNAPARDPDCQPTVEAFERGRLERFVHAVTPGSRHWLSYISLSFVFTLQGQIFIWYYSSLPEYKAVRMNRIRERALAVLLFAGWAALGYVIGLEASLYVIVLPMVVANITLMSYIATQHWMCDATPSANDPFVNTVSVRTNWLFDLLHVNFSYHQEHHLFPSMNGRYFPEVRAAMRSVRPSLATVYPHLQALIALYKKPALYLDNQTLSHPRGADAVSTENVRARLHPLQG